MGDGRVQWNRDMVWMVDEVPVMDIHEDGHGLTEDERKPNNNVAGTASFQELVGENRKRDLGKHSIECP